MRGQGINTFCTIQIRINVHLTHKTWIVLISAGGMRIRYNLDRLISLLDKVICRAQDSVLRSFIGADLVDIMFLTMSVRGIEEIDERSWSREEDSR